MMSFTPFEAAYSCTPFTSKSGYGVSAAVPEHLRNVPAVFHAPYGFKLVEVNGEKLWESGTLEDWRGIMALHRGVAKEINKQGGLCDPPFLNDRTTEAP
jgi:hypothetical protein